MGQDGRSRTDWSDEAERIVAALLEQRELSDAQEAEVESCLEDGDPYRALEKLQEFR